MMVVMLLFFRFILIRLAGEEVVRGELAVATPRQAGYPQSGNVRMGRAGPRRIATARRWADSLPFTAVHGKGRQGRRWLPTARRMDEPRHGQRLEGVIPSRMEVHLEVAA